MLRPVIHILLHLFIPGIVARVSFKKYWIKSWVIMVLTIIIDLDHLLADPIYDPNRCSIGFHPLHSYGAICLYVVLLSIPRTRIIGAGLVIHIFLDLTDCIWINFL